MVSECEDGGYGLLQGGRWTGCIGNVVRGVCILVFPSHLQLFIIWRSPGKQNVLCCVLQYPV